MATAGGPDIERDGLVFGYDTGYGIADNSTATRFYPGKATENLISANGLDFTQMSTYGYLTRTQVVDINSPSGYACEMEVTDGVAINPAARIAFGANTNIPSNGNAMVSVYIKFEGGSSSNITPKVYNGSGTAWQTLAPLDGGSAYLTNEYRRFGYYGSIAANPGFSMTKENSSIQTGQKTRWHSPQVELTTHATPFVNGTRSSTQSLIDLTKTTDIDVSNVSFDSNGLPTFDGTDDKIADSWPSSFDSDDNTTDRSWEVILKTTSTGNQGVFGHKSGTGCSYYCNGGIFLYNGNITFNWYDNSNYQFLNGGSITTNKYMHVVGTFDGADAKPRIYVNGELKATYGSSTNLNYSSGMNIYDIGWNSKSGGQHYFSGEIPIVKYYKDKALSLSEVQQNFKAYKNRFDI